MTYGSDLTPLLFLDWTRSTRQGPRFWAFYIINHDWLFRGQGPITLGLLYFLFYPDLVVCLIGLVKPYFYFLRAIGRPSFYSYCKNQSDPGSLSGKLFWNANSPSISVLNHVLEILLPFIRKNLSHSTYQNWPNQQGTFDIRPFILHNQNPTASFKKTTQWKQLLPIIA